MPEEVELCVVQLPGRGARFNEHPYVQMASLIEVLSELLPAILDRSYAFFGHSLGALICFELARTIRNEGLRQPGLLFVSACNAPSKLPMVPTIHTLPDQAFISELRRFNGTPTDVLENNELMTLMLPALRADFALFDSYVYAEDFPLTCPIIAFGGRDDEMVDPESMSAWQNQTSGEFTLQLLPGDHFYINSSWQTLLTYIRDGLEQEMSGRARNNENRG